MKSLEHNLQKSCFHWFRLQYPEYAGAFFAIPNGGKRSVATAVRLKAEGVLAGVSDAFLAVANNSSNGLFIEFKAGKNKVTDKQGEFINTAIRNGYSVHIIYDFNSFVSAINAYLK